MTRASTTKPTAAKAGVGALAGSRGGFSLIEVLVGVLVVGLFLAGAYTLYSVLVNVDGHRKQLVSANAAMISAVERIKALPWDSLTGEFSDRCPDSLPVPPGQTLQCQVVPKDAAELQDAALVEVTVKALDAEGDLIDQIQFLRFEEGL